MAVSGPETAFTRQQICRHLDLGLLSLQNWEESVLFISRLVCAVLLQRH